jgi:hypothetical protein
LFRGPFAFAFVDGKEVHFQNLRGSLFNDLIYGAIGCLTGFQSSCEELEICKSATEYIDTIVEFCEVAVSLIVGEFGSINSFGFEMGDDKFLGYFWCNVSERDLSEDPVR